MRLLLGTLHRVLAVLRQSWTGAVESWHQFWFRPADPLMLGILRLLVGWMLFYNLLIWSLDLEAFFGDNGLQPLEAVRQLYGSQFVFSFWLWIGDEHLWPVHIGCLMIAAMFCLGLATRVTSILAFLITISYSQRVPIANFGFDQILGLLCLYLAIGPSGAAVSLDSLIRRWRRKSVPMNVPKSASARMAMRLIQLHLCAIYLWAGFAKLKGPSWWTGEAMWRVLANQEYQTLDMTWMASVPWLPYLMAHVTIAWEVFFIVLVWNRRLRPLVLAIGVLMHLGIGAFLGMWTFGLIMAFAYLAFADPDVWRARLRMMARRLSRRSSAATCIPVADQHAAESVLAQLPNHVVSEPEAEDSILPVEESPAAAGSLSPVRQVCVIATNSNDRSMLRRYFREHGVACRAVGDLNQGLDALSRQQFSSVLVNAIRISTVDLIEFVEDVADLTGLPTLVMLAKQQQEAAERIQMIDGVRCINLPASLKEIREHLQSLNRVFPDQSLSADPEPRLEARL